MQKGYLSESMMRPVVSRVRNIGQEGVNVSPEIYAKLRLGQTPRLELTASQVRALDWGQLYVNATGGARGARPSEAEAWVGGGRGPFGGKPITDISVFDVFKFASGQLFSPPPRRRRAKPRAPSSEGTNLKP